LVASVLQYEMYHIVHIFVAEAKSEASKSKHLILNKCEDSRYSTILKPEEITKEKLITFLSGD